MTPTLNSAGNKYTEGLMQAITMRLIMGAWKHEIVIPNTTTFLNWSWECDLLSVTKTGLIHEYEIKVTKGDYSKDSKKHKHHFLMMKDNYLSPSYFWYVTCFDIEPPEHAGWLKVNYGRRFDWDTKDYYFIEGMKDAPRLCKLHISDDRYKVAARLLSWKVTKLAEKLYNNGGSNNG